MGLVIGIIVASKINYDDLGKSHCDLSQCSSYEFWFENILVLNQASYGEKTNDLIDQMDGVNLNVEHLGEELSGIDETVHVLNGNIENLNGSINTFNNDLGNISSHLSSLVKGYSLELATVW